MSPWAARVVPRGCVRAEVPVPGCHASSWDPLRKAAKPGPPSTCRRQRDGSWKGLVISFPSSVPRGGSASRPRSCVMRQECCAEATPAAAAKYRRRTARLRACAHIRTITGRRRQDGLDPRKQGLLRPGPGPSLGETAALPDRQLGRLHPFVTADLVAPRPCSVTGVSTVPRNAWGSRTVLRGGGQTGLMSESPSFPSPPLLMRVTDRPVGPTQFRFMPVESRWLLTTPTFPPRGDLPG